MGPFAAPRVSLKLYKLMFFKLLFFIYLFIYFAFLPFSRAAPAAYGGSQARGRIGAVAAGLHHSHSNVGSEPHLQPTSQLMATLDPQTTEGGQGSNLHPHGC